MASGVGAAAVGMKDAFGGDDDDNLDNEDPEDELRKWEQQIQRLDYTKYHGFRRLQVQTWLLFEDSASSRPAAFMEVLLLILIVLSTVLILVKSMTNCYYVTDTSSMERCIVNSTHAPSGSCTRVCDKRPDFVLEYFVIEAICIGAFTVEFLARLLASPATVGLCSFCCAPANMIDLLAIAPFYIELSFLVSSGSSGSGANALAVLRIVRLTRVLRVVKKSKSLSGLLVLLRTLIKSLVAVLMIITFAILTCIVCSSLMHSTPEVGSWKKYRSWPSQMTTECFKPGACERGMYIGENNEQTAFANMGEVWWWCLQTLTSEGYGVPWVPITTWGKIIGVMAALLGTIVLALPIAVIGMHFDDEWTKNRREQKFEAHSRVARFNSATQYGTQKVKVEALRATKNVVGAVLPSLNKVHLEPQKDPNFSDQAFNVQADLSHLIDEHFSNLRKQVEQTLDMHREKLTRSIHRDLETVIKNRAVARSGIEAFMKANLKPTKDENLEQLAEQNKRKSGVAVVLGKGLAAHLSSQMGVALADANSRAAQGAPTASPQPALHVQTECPGMAPAVADEDSPEEAVKIVPGPEP